MIGNTFTSLPGMGGIYETASNEFRWGRDWNMLYAGGQLDSAARDAGSVPTTTLRMGLVLGTISATGNLTAYSAAATDGSNVPTGILAVDVNVLDRGNVPANQFVWMVVGGPVKPANLFGFDEAARGQMANRFQFDDRGYSSAPSALGGGAVAKTANYTVVSGTDNNATFTNQGATGAITFTLPTTIVKGNRWRFTAEANFAITVAAPAGKLVAFNNAAATSVSFSTAGQIVGGTFEITVNADGTKYIANVLSTGNTVTVA